MYRRYGWGIGQCCTRLWERRTITGADEARLSQTKAVTWMAVEVTLPYRTDWREMSSVLDYCKGKGAERSALEARFGAGEALRETLNALEQLALIERGDSGDVRLTVRGEQLAYAPDAARRRARLIDALLGYPPYRFPLERALADAPDVLEAAWVEHIWQVDMRLGQPRNRVEEARTCFFRLADEAGLGTYRRGVRGQTTRLELAPDFSATLAPLLRGAATTARPSAAATSVRSSGQRSAPGTAGAAGAATTEAGLASGMDTSQLAAGVFDSPVASMDGSVRAAEARQAHGPVGAAGTALSLHVDMSDWELDKIEAFLRLIGYLPRRD
jgi:hypothetical protein